MYWREISHVKRHGAAETHTGGDTRFSPLQFTHSAKTDRKSFIINGLSPFHRLLDLSSGVIRFEFLPFVVQFASFPHPEFDLHKPA